MDIHSPTKSIGPEGFFKIYQYFSKANYDTTNDSNYMNFFFFNSLDQGLSIDTFFVKIECILLQELSFK